MVKNMSVYEYVYVCVWLGYLCGFRYWIRLPVIYTLQSQEIYLKNNPRMMITEIIGRTKESQINFSRIYVPNSVLTNISRMLLFVSSPERDTLIGFFLFTPRLVPGVKPANKVCPLEQESSPRPSNVSHKLTHNQINEPWRNKIYHK